MEATKKNKEKEFKSKKKSKKNYFTPLKMAKELRG